VQNDCPCLGASQNLFPFPLLPALHCSSLLHRLFSSLSPPSLKTPLCWDSGAPKLPPCHAGLFSFQIFFVPPPFLPALSCSFKSGLPSAEVAFFFFSSPLFVEDAPVFCLFFLSPDFRRPSYLRHISALFRTSKYSSKEWIFFLFTVLVPLVLLRCALSRLLSCRWSFLKTVRRVESFISV